MSSARQNRVSDKCPKPRFAVVISAETRDERSMSLELTVTGDNGRQGGTLRQMTRGVPIAGGFGTNQRVLDQGPQQQRRGERLGALQPACHRIEQPVQIAVDLGVPVDDELCGVTVRGPPVEEMQRGRECRKSERILHRTFLC